MFATLLLTLALFSADAQAGVRVHVRVVLPPVTAEICNKRGTVCGTVHIDPSPRPRHRHSRRCSHSKAKARAHASRRRR